MSQNQVGRICLHYNQVNIVHCSVCCLQYFPGRPVVMNSLKSLNSWLQVQTANEISYKAFREVLENTAQVSKNSAIQTFIQCRIGIV